MSLLDRIVASEVPQAMLLVALMVGAVFPLEGRKTFMDPAPRGPGRFEKLGFPHAALIGCFAGTFETLRGALAQVARLRGP